MSVAVSENLPPLYRARILEKAFGFLTHEYISHIADIRVYGQSNIDECRVLLSSGRSVLMETNHTSSFDVPSVLARVITAVKPPHITGLAAAKFFPDPYVHYQKQTEPSELRKRVEAYHHTNASPFEGRLLDAFAQHFGMRVYPIVQTYLLGDTNDVAFYNTRFDLSMITKMTEYISQNPGTLAAIAPEGHRNENGTREAFSGIAKIFRKPCNQDSIYILPIAVAYLKQGMLPAFFHHGRKEGKILVGKVHRYQEIADLAEKYDLKPHEAIFLYVVSMTPAELQGYFNQKKYWPIIDEIQQTPWCSKLLQEASILPRSQTIYERREK